MSCDQDADKELIDCAETAEERNDLKQHHHTLLRQMVDFDVGQAAPTAGEAAEPVVAAQATVCDE